MPGILWQWIRAGPREALFFDPRTVVAGIVTCGGLCPGLNNVIQAVTMTLLENYGAKKVWGIPFGFQGFLSVTPHKLYCRATGQVLQQAWQELDARTVSFIHKRGGTILGSSRGNRPDEHIGEIMERLIMEGVTQLYVIGGDGTHKGANVISQEAVRRRLNMTVCCVPKTIDNDIAFIDKSFGFDTAVDKAVSLPSSSPPPSLCVRACTSACTVACVAGIVRVIICALRSPDPSRR
jgi:6-phosphofructokinase 1